MSEYNYKTIGSAVLNMLKIIMYKLRQIYDFSRQQNVIERSKEILISGIF